MRNRDYFTRPIQGGGRSSHDYGHTRFAPVDRSGDRWWIVGLLLVVTAGFLWRIVAS